MPGSPTTTIRAAFLARPQHQWLCESTSCNHNGDECVPSSPSGLQNANGEGDSIGERKLMNISNHSREEIALWVEGGGEARERWMLYKVLMLVIALFLLLPGSLLVSIGWSYVGGGPEFEKIHPATYLLVAVFSWALIVNRSFRWRCIAYSVSDCAFIAFALAALSTITFAIAVNGASASNFIDTFVVALIIRIAIVAVPRRPMVQFRTFIDIYFIVTIVLVFAEYRLNRNFIPQSFSLDDTPDIPTIFDTPTTETDTDFRSAGLFDHPLAAAGFLALYSILNLVATPVRLSPACAGRLLLAGLSFVAIFPTGGRSALVVSALVMFVFIAWSALRSLAKGSFNKAGLVFFVTCLAFLVLTLPIMWQLGVLDVMLRRFEDDYGSALSRVYALQILPNMRFEDLWFGLSQQDALNLQNDYGMAAIENTWINFTLALRTGLDGNAALHLRVVFVQIESALLYLWNLLYSNISIHSLEFKQWPLGQVYECSESL